MYQTAAKIKVESINLWIENKKFQTETSSEIIKIVQKKFREEEDIYVEILISELPAQLQWDVKNEICFEPLKQVSFFILNMPLNGIINIIQQ